MNHLEPFWTCAQISSVFWPFPPAQLMLPEYRITHPPWPLTNTGAEVVIEHGTPRICTVIGFPGANVEADELPVMTTSPASASRPSSLFMRVIIARICLAGNSGAISFGFSAVSAGLGLDCVYDPAVAERLSFAFDPAYRPLARLFGVTPENAWVEVTDDALHVRFGPWRVKTPLRNVIDVAVTGPYRYLKTAGPARLAITDRGLTFATNGRRGLRISFAEKIPGIDPLDLIRHPELTVTVSDVEALARLLEERRHAGAPV